MEKISFLGKIKSLILSHKKLSILVLVVVIVGSYFLFFRNKSNAQVRYVTETIAKGNVVSSVSGTGQIESSDTLNINAKTSGEITSVSVKVGQSVNKGDLIATIDSRDARIALENAKLSLDKLKTPDSLTVLQKGNTLDKSYTDSWNNASSFIIDSQTILDGLDSLYNTGYLGTNSRSTLSNSVKTKINISESAYYDAEKSFSNTKKLYNSMSITSSKDDIEKLVNNVYLTSKKISNAVKLTQTSYDYTFDDLDQKTSTESTTTANDINSWTSTSNSYVNSLANNLNNISENKASLADTLAGSDVLDIRQAELNVETKQNAYNDCFIRASFDGVIASLTAKVGQTASGTIGTIIAKQKIVKVSLNEVDIAKIKLGQKATLTFDAIEGLDMTGVVEEIDSVGTVSSGVVTYNVSITLDVDDSRVKPGMSVSATIITDSVSDAIVVSNSAVKTKNGSSYVEVFDSALPTPATGVTGSTSSVAPRQVAVETGLSNDTSTVITSGLKEGDIVVTKTITTSSSSSTKTTASTTSGSSKSSSSTSATRMLSGGGMSGGGPRD